MLASVDEDLLTDVLRGLHGSPKKIPCKYFYDRRGSRLFDRLCATKEYYPTRTEIRILRENIGGIAARLGPGVTLIELGSGSGEKTELLLANLPEISGFVPVDICPVRLRESAVRLSSRFPGLAVYPVCADFTRPFEVPENGGGRRVFYFPGSTIGNFMPDEAETFLAHLLAEAGGDGGILLGVDLKKDKWMLEAAYNDSQGLTAEFNRNVLRRIHRELGVDVDPAVFRHRAFYNPAEGRIEMHLVSRCEQTIHLGGEEIAVGNGESILTEYSYKYGLDEFRRFAAGAGARVDAVWTDPRRLFSVQYLVPA